MPPLLLGDIMTDIIAYTLTKIFDIITGPYFRYTIGILCIMGIINLIYYISGKSK